MPERQERYVRAWLTFSPPLDPFYGHKGAKVADVLHHTIVDLVENRLLVQRMSVASAIRTIASAHPSAVALIPASVALISASIALISTSGRPPETYLIALSIT